MHICGTGIVSNKVKDYAWNVKLIVVEMPLWPENVPSVTSLPFLILRLLIDQP
jgi:hypothetical protein